MMPDLPDSGLWIALTAFGAVVAIGITYLRKAWLMTASTPRNRTVTISGKQIDTKTGDIKFVSCDPNLAVEDEDHATDRLTYGLPMSPGPLVAAPVPWKPTQVDQVAEPPNMDKYGAETVMGDTGAINLDAIKLIAEHNQSVSTENEWITVWDIGNPDATYINKKTGERRHKPPVAQLSPPPPKEYKTRSEIMHAMSEGSITIAEAETAMTKLLFRDKPEPKPEPPPRPPHARKLRLQ
jgi:hypothetical protein